LRKRGCLFIDESNHGRYPEIVVGVHSFWASDTEKKIERLPKIKSKIMLSKSVPQILNGRDFRHILLPEEYRDILGHIRRLKIVSFAELIKFYETLDKVFIDGEFPDAHLAQLEKLIHPIKIPKIEGFPDGDRRYNGLNTADMIARKLFRGHYSVSPRRRDVNLSSYLNDYLITIKIEQYTPFFGLSVKHP